MVRQLLQSRLDFKHTTTLHLHANLSRDLTSICNFNSMLLIPLQNLVIAATRSNLLPPTPSPSPSDNEHRLRIRLQLAATCCEITGKIHPLTQYTHLWSKRTTLISPLPSSHKSFPNLIHAKSARVTLTTLLWRGGGGGDRRDGSAGKGMPFFGPGPGVAGGVSFSVRGELGRCQAFSYLPKQVGFQLLGFGGRSAGGLWASGAGPGCGDWPACRTDGNRAGPAGSVGGRW
jgi:hypothetical protein